MFLFPGSLWESPFASPSFVALAEADMGLNCAFLGCSGWWGAQNLGIERMKNMRIKDI